MTCVNCKKRYIKIASIKELKDAKKEQTVFKTKLHLCLENLSHYFTRNVNERINTQKGMSQR